MPGPVFRRGEAVALRPVEEADLPFLRRWWNEPDVRRWLPATRPVDEADGEARLEGFLTEDPCFVVTPADGEERLGYAALFDVKLDSGRAKLAAWLKPDARGEGYGAAATRQLVAHAFEDRRLDRLTAGTLAHNDASRATLETVGFRQEGVMRDLFFVNGERVDHVVYGLLREEWSEASDAQAPP